MKESTLICLLLVLSLNFQQKQKASSAKKNHSGLVGSVKIHYIIQYIS